MPLRSIKQAACERGNLFWSAPSLELRQTSIVVHGQAFDAAHAAEEPIAVDEGVDGGLLERANGTAAGLVFAGEGLESLGVLAVDDEGLRVGAGFEGVEGSGGFPGAGGRSSGFLRITTIRIDLSL